MKTFDFHYTVHEVDGKEFELIECTTWPRLNVQVLHTTPERFEADLKEVKSRSLCGYSLQDKTFILKHAGGEGNGELTQANINQILDGGFRIGRSSQLRRKNRLGGPFPQSSSRSSHG